MKKIKLFVAIIILVLFMCGCKQTISRNYGGTTEIELEPGKKLVEVTWKNSDLWYLVEPMEPNYVPKTKEFIESSNYGILEGKVIFYESK